MGLGLKNEDRRFWEEKAGLGGGFGGNREEKVVKSMVLEWAEVVGGKGWENGVVCDMGI